MSCSRFRLRQRDRAAFIDARAPLVDDYVRNRLDAERRQKVCRHLAHCPKCRTVVEQRNRTRAERSVS